jgi:putative restriction endonuclease
MGCQVVEADIAFGLPESREPAPPQDEIEWRYALRAVKQRLHQASFREAVMQAYGGRCAVSGLPESRLLDAAHIVADSDEMMGHAMVTNGIPLSKIHHAAFDAHLIGIDPDHRLHVSRQLLEQNDGPMLKGLKKLQGVSLHLPRRAKDYPDRDRLSLRFERFRAAY